MSLVGSEIVQTVKWLDPNNPPPPNLNHMNTFPITVFDAVKMDMYSDGPTLSDVIASIRSELNTKQALIPGKPANYLVTYAGTPGAVGAIKMTQDIPLKFEDQRSDLIPTEKAIGEFLLKLGLLDADGNPTVGNDPDSATIRWSQIIGRPNAYYVLGDNDDGYITQKAVTDAIKKIQDSIVDKLEENLGAIDVLRGQLSRHLTDYKNPHQVTAEQIGAISKEIFEEHLNASNPHNITKEDVGLSNVDNTSDEDKPISKATQEAIDDILEKLGNITTDDGTPINGITDITYDPPNNTLTLKYGSSSTKDIKLIGANNSIIDITFDIDTQEIVIKSRDGSSKKLNLSALNVNVTGSEGSEITVEVDNDSDENQKVIKANLVQHSITSVKIADDAIEPRNIKDQSVTTAKIMDEGVTTDKIAPNAVTSEKIAPRAITTTKIADRAVEGRNIFTSDYDDRVLVSLKANSDPVWSQISHGMMGVDSVGEDNIINGSITSEKIAEKTITSDNIADGTITSDKLADGTITSDNIGDGTIEGGNIVDDVELPGTPSAGESPAPDSDNNELATTKWIRNYVKNIFKEITILTDNLEDRAVDGSKLFTSEEDNKVLGVTKGGTDPKWITINHDMLDDDIIANLNIRDNAVDGRTIADGSIANSHLGKKVVDTINLNDGAVTSEKIWKSPNKNVVLGVLKEDSSPVYTTINGDMIEENAIDTNKIQDNSITPTKLTSSEQAHRLLAVTLANTTPQWTQATNGMIGNRAVDGRTLFSSPIDDRILATTIAGQDPAWLQINTRMIGDGQVQSVNIAEGAIKSEHIGEKVIDSTHIKDWIIKTNNIAPRAITGVELFTSPVPNRVLAVTGAPYSNPDWLQVTTDMIEDAAVTKEKIFLSENPYRVLATTQAGTPPEYIRITGDFIVEDSIKPINLQRDFTLFGTPSLTVEPDIEADNLQLATTAWVRKIVQDIHVNVTIDDIIAPHSIDGTYLMTSDKGPRVLGVTEAGADVEFLLIEENLLVDGAVTTNKLQRDIHLLGSPVVEVRPIPSASDSTGFGSLIPDCQWVLDRIKEAQLSGGGGSSSYNTVQNIPVPDVSIIMNGKELDDNDAYEFTDDGSVLRSIKKSDIAAIIDAVDDIENNLSTVENGVSVSYISDEDIHNIVDGNYEVEDDGITGTGPGTGVSVPGGGGELVAGSVTTYHIQNRAVTGQKLFTSSLPNMVLSVTGSNTDPAWTKITSDMIDDRNITPRKLFTTSTPSRVLIVRTSNSDPVWGQIEAGMIAANAVTTDNIANGTVTNAKIANASITANKLASEAIITAVHISDNSITTGKIVDGAVTGEKIKNGSVTGNKLAENIELPASISVASSTNYERRALRNTILSPDAPSGGEDGDIWFRYV